MKSYKVTQVNCETGEVVLRDMTQTEIEQREKDYANAEIRKAEIAAKVQAKETAQAKLAALGLTLEDLQALGL